MSTIETLSRTSQGQACPSCATPQSPHTTTPASLRPGAIQPSLQLSRYVPIWLSGRRGLMLVAGTGIGVGAIVGWPWLASAAVGPILLSTLPCVAMCALGLCMMGGGGKSCASQGSKIEANSGDATTPITTESVSSTRQIADMREPAQLS